MKNPEFFRATISALITWGIGVTAFVLSYSIPLMENPDTQASWVLVLALIPATALGAGYYFKKGYRTNGRVLGTYMFGATILLDACITVPVFIIPDGGNHATFFGDPMFWLIGVEYIGLIMLYAQIRARMRQTETDPKI